MGGDRYLPPRILQYLGMALVVASFVFWGLTGRESLLLMTSAMTLIGVGSYEAAFRALLNRRLEDERERLRSKPLPPPSTSEQPDEA